MRRWTRMIPTPLPVRQRCFRSEESGSAPAPLRLPRRPGPRVDDLSLRRPVPPPAAQGPDPGDQRGLGGPGRGPRSPAAPHRGDRPGGAVHAAGDRGRPRADLGADPDSLATADPGHRANPRHPGYPGAGYPGPARPSPATPTAPAGTPTNTAPAPATPEGEITNPLN
ncbi:hypothetical protein QP028_00565 [Corynebacterium suedekumii]|nr:hypothetical protein QP028_00565 [Corynebacterium suedekumii]